MEPLSNDHKDHPNQHKNNHKLWKMETEATTSELLNEGKVIIEQIIASEERNSRKEQDCESHSQ